VAAYARVSTGSDEQLTSYEAQVDYYTRFIQSREGLEFVMVYADEGISAVNTKKRDGFNQMVAAALTGGIDLISQKACRGSLETRWTASRPSENSRKKAWKSGLKRRTFTRWTPREKLLIRLCRALRRKRAFHFGECHVGQRKRMADGKVTLPYAQFSATKKARTACTDSSREANGQAHHRLFMEGKTASAIANASQGRVCQRPPGKTNGRLAAYSPSCKMRSTKGMPSCKRRSAQSLTKEMSKKPGQVQQYYVEDSHPSIIEPDEWERFRPRPAGARARSIGRCGNPFSGKIISENAAATSAKKSGQLQSDKTYRREVYQCNEKYNIGQRGSQCGNALWTEGEVKAHFLTAFQYVDDRPRRADYGLPMAQFPHKRHVGD
jgi:hypothetical protein